MFSRVGPALVIAAALVAAQNTVGTAQEQVPIVHESEGSLGGIFPSPGRAVASKLGFRSSMRLLVRQWSFLEHAAETEVMSLFRVDASRKASEIEELLREARTDGRVVLMTPTEEDDGDFVGRYLAVDGSASVPSTEVFFSWASDVLGALDAKAGEEGLEFFVAAPSSVEGWAADTDVVFFDFPSSSEVEDQTDSIVE